MNFQYFVTTKVKTRSHISCSENALKLTYNNVEFQNCSGEDPRSQDHPLKGSVNFLDGKREEGVFEHEVIYVAPVDGVIVNLLIYYNLYQMNFQYFLTTKLLTRNHISSSENALKLTYSNVEFQYFPGRTPVPSALRRREGRS